MSVIKYEQPKIDERSMEQYNDIVTNIKPLTVLGKGKNQKVITGSAVVPLSRCFVDYRYQGLRKHKTLHNLESKWNERKLTPIILVPHPEEYRFAIVDGQGRWKVAKNKGIDRLNAIILLDAPEDISERLKFEAEYFIGQDQEVERVKPLEKHLSRLIIGDPAAVSLEKILNKYNVSVTDKSGSRSESVLGSYPKAYEIASVQGEKCLDFIFNIIKCSGWNKESNGYSVMVMEALKEIWIMHPLYREETKDFLSKQLKQTDPKLFRSEAKTKYPIRDYRHACMLYMDDIVVNGLKLEKNTMMELKKMKVLSR